jgi:hypothetical protein
VQPPVPANRTSGHAIRTAIAAAVLVVVHVAPAHADLGSTRRPKGYLTFGPTFEIDTDASLRFGGEVALTSYSGRSGYGIAAGFVPGRIYLEFQPVWVLGGKAPKSRWEPQKMHHLVLGLNPGAVVDVTKNVPCYGVQLTLWGNYIRSTDARGGGRPSFAWPVFPFFRVQAVEWLGFVFTGGLMLKLPISLT